MTELPTGTVTFLFTDVEGSTRLVRQLRERYGELISEHRRLLRDAFAAHGGHEIDTQGDSFFFVFRRAKDAVAGAVAAQQALHTHPWPAGAAFRVRIGMHTGEPAIADDRYVGLGVHRAARVMAAGHGGQILLSQATAAVFQDDELPEIELRDLGSHHLKDLTQPEHIFQLVAPGLPEEFPPLSADRAAEADDLVAGRSAELEQAAREAVARPVVLRRRSLVMSVVAGVLAAAVAIPVFALADGDATSELEAIAANAAGVIDGADGKLVGEVPLADRPSLAAAAGQTIWVASDLRKTVSAIDGSSRRPVHVTPTGMRAGALAADAGGAWLVDRFGRRLVRVDRDYGEAARPTSLPRPPDRGPVRDVAAQPGLAVGNDAVWITTGSSQLLKVDPKTRKVVRSIDTGLSLDAVAVGDGSVWLASGPSATVLAVDPASGAVRSRIPIVGDPDATSPFPRAIAVADGAVWTLNANTSSVTKIDPQTRGVVATITLGAGRAPTSLAAGAGAVWISNRGDGTVTRVDSETHETESIRVGNSPAGLAAAGDEVWVTVQPSLATPQTAPAAQPPAAHSLTLPASFCSPVETAAGGKPDLLIAAEMPLQGVAAQFGGQLHQAILFQLRRRNFEAGRFAVGYQVCDDSNSAGTHPSAERCAANAREYARTRRLVALIAPITSPCTQALLPIVNAAPGGPLATATYSNTYVGLTRSSPGGAADEPGRYYPSGRRNLVRLLAADDYQAAAAITYARRRGLEQAYVLDDGSSYGVGLADAFRRGAGKLGVRITGSATFAEDAPSYRSLARTVRASGADMVYIAGIVVPGSTLLADLREALGRGFPLLGGDGLQTVLKQPGQFGRAAEGLIFTVPGLPEQRLAPAGREFVAAFAREIKSTPLPFAVYAAQAADVLLDAIARSDGTRTSVTARLMATEVRNGMLGDFSFTSTGDPTAGAVTLYVWRRGTSEVLTVITPSLQLVASR
jgi:class 3 adenylate cyclase/ABC-type branched-subunit amino acid transport system substrate-binding protein